MASIECQIVFENKTKSNLDLIKKSVEHGVFLSDPPAKIPAGMTGSWHTGSDGWATGSETIVEYKCPVSGRVYYLHAANPYVGSTWERHSIRVDDGLTSLNGHAGASSGGRADYSFKAEMK